jgi:hypothetical protein
MASKLAPAHEGGDCHAGTRNALIALDRDDPISI